MSRRQQQSRDSWNNIKRYFSKGTTLGPRQLAVLYWRVEIDYGGKNASYNDSVFSGVDDSLLKRGFLERHILSHKTIEDCTTPLTHLQWWTRITEKGLKEFIKNGGEDIKIGIQDHRSAVRELLVRSGWAEREEWMKYLALGYLPAA